MFNLHTPNVYGNVDKDESLFMGSDLRRQLGKFMIHVQ